MIKKLLLFPIFFCFFCLVLVGCSQKEKNIEIILMTNGGVPYKWEYEIEDDSIVSYDHMDSVNKDPGTAGGRVEQHYYFKGLKEGSTTIQFQYKNFTNDTIDQEKTYHIVVDSDLNITITEQE